VLQIARAVCPLNFVFFYVITFDEAPFQVINIKCSCSDPLRSQSKKTKRRPFFVQICSIYWTSMICQENTSEEVNDRRYTTTQGKSMPHTHTHVDKNARKKLGRGTWEKTERKVKGVADSQSPNHCSSNSHCSPVQVCGMSWSTIKL